jgi:hypothetical protein
MSRSHAAAIGVLLLLAGVIVPALVDSSELVLVSRQAVVGQAQSCVPAVGGASRIVPLARAGELSDGTIVVSSPRRCSDASNGNAAFGGLTASRMPLHRLLRVYLI